MTTLLQGLTVSAFGIACACRIGIPIATAIGINFVGIFIGAIVTYKFK